MSERERIEGPDRRRWLLWGPYLFARSWGTVRENPGRLEKPWTAFPYEHARSRCYLFGEDGIAGFSDDRQRLCLSLALWNERDPHLKERFFGLSNEEGSHGEELKDYFYYLDGLPSHAWMSMLYRYPQVEFPFSRLRRENGLRTRGESPFQLADALEPTFLEKAYFDVTVEAAKGDPEDLLLRFVAVNKGPREAPLHFLPHLWYRRLWQSPDERPRLRAVGSHRVKIEHPELEGYLWEVEPGARLLFTENETNRKRLFDRPNRLAWVRDGIDEAVARGRRECLNPEQTGTRCAAHLRRVLQPGETWTVRVRLSRGERDWSDFDEVFERRSRELREFYAELNPRPPKPSRARIQRRAFAGLTWNQCFYQLPVQRWLQGDPEDPGPVGAAPDKMLAWSFWNAHDILSIPDNWEYPWNATWDLSFQMATYCLIDPRGAQDQLLALLGPRYMRPDGAIVTFEQDPGMPHPPVILWAVWMVYHLSGRPREFLEQAFEPCRRHFDWWLRNHQPERGLFNGGFLGKDNISPIDRNDLPEGYGILQADSTGWMALAAMHLLGMAIELGADEEGARCLDELLAIRRGLERLWSDEHEFLFDVLLGPEGNTIEVPVRSFVGLIAVCATLKVDPRRLGRCARLRQRLEELERESSDFEPMPSGNLLLAALPLDKVGRILRTLFDPEEFLSTYGLRSLSRFHRAHPVCLELEGKKHELEYEPGWSKVAMMGGNSNWRGPIWAPLNQLAIYALHHYAEKLPELDLEARARDLADRTIALFERDDLGHVPIFGDNHLFQSDPDWNEHLWFYEHFHGETGAGLGASHQNGWTAAVAGLIHHMGQTVFVPDCG